MVDNNDALLREVDEELRREQLERLWKKYGSYALMAAALIVVGVGGAKWLEARRLAASEAAGASYAVAVSALAGGRADEAEKALKALASEAPGGYGTLAELHLAGAAMKAGKTADAVRRLDEIVKDRSADPLLKSFAQLQAASLRVSEADFTEMQNRLNDLVSSGSPWRGNARELLGIAAMKAGKPDEARTYFEQILGERNTPQSVVERARTMMGTLVVGELSKQKSVPNPASSDPAGSAAKPETPATPSSKP